MIIRIFTKYHWFWAFGKIRSVIGVSSFCCPGHLTQLALWARVFWPHAEWFHKNDMAMWKYFFSAKRHCIWGGLLVFVWEGLDGVEDVVGDESEVPLVAAGGGSVLILVSLVVSWKGFGYRHLNKVSAHDNATFFKQLPKPDGAQNSTRVFWASRQTKIVFWNPRDGVVSASGLALQMKCSTAVERRSAIYWIP